GFLTLRIGGPGDWHDAAGVVPGQGHLAATYAVAPADVGEQGFVDKPTPVAQRAPRLGDDTAGVVPLHLLDLWEIGVELDLVDHRQLAGLGVEAVDVFGQEVGHPDVAHQAAVAGVDKRLPRLHVEVAVG